MDDLMGVCAQASGGYLPSGNSEIVDRVLGDHDSTESNDEKRVVIDASLWADPFDDPPPGCHEPSDLYTGVSVRVLSMCRAILLCCDVIR